MKFELKASCNCHANYTSYVVVQVDHEVKLDAEAVGFMTMAAFRQCKQEAIKQCEICRSEK